MSKDIKVKKGLNLRFKGEAEQTLVEAPKSKTFAIKPPDFHAVVPKLVLKEGAKVQAGEVIFFSKYNEAVKFSSPVSGTIVEVVRGAKRRVLEIVIEADAVNSYKEYGTMSAESSDAEAVKTRIFESGCGAFIKQRPYDIVANPEDAPKAIYISAYNTAPLAADPEFILQDQKAEFQEGIKALKKLTAGKVYLAVNKKSSNLKDIQDVEILNVSGPHPAGNVGVHVHETEPINGGDRVWTVGPEDVAIIGRLFLTGKFDAKRTIAVVGADAKDKKYFRTLLGTNVSALVGEVNESASRIISGDMLTGLRLTNNQFVGFYDNTVTVIPEGNNYRMFGWLPFTYNNIHSMSKTSLSWMFPNKKYDVNTNLNGEERALVVTGEMEEVMPLDVYPMQLLKACMTGDVEKMENLGIYEVIPEDFALVDYVNTSKIEAQEIIRLGLDLMITEVG
ncbi:MULTISPECIES: Na(+)-translocating NADH-quinone reductase subunit A [Mesonia]|uniref:Na(+)-translocating NADH-quinone reductase subunit A n=1 Tax=Mesonia TaxID=232115 RepID=UPI000E9C1DF8|nr:Na(+)-translocating NADH-quinone reductase subunit A [Mesonia mobilis]HAT69988.1 NADH:ubiquinone reductase (Na(+)-transporting) subunit A [Flavobacteriaceae bacterium]|tara:strand:+ start:47 stop:1390 length:1344 start_codon:yes stop_codon:yes gene_type:complete